MSTMSLHDLLDEVRRNHNKGNFEALFKSLSALNEMESIIKVKIAQLHIANGEELKAVDNLVEVLKKNPEHASAQELLNKLISKNSRAREYYKQMCSGSTLQ